MAATGRVTNPRGIPQAPFVEDVGAFVADKNIPVKDVLDGLQEQYSKYKFMEINCTNRKGTLQTKLPEIERTLSAVEFLRSRTDESEPVNTRFELSDTLFAKATIRNPDKVYLWLGANVMLEYTLDEAKALLTKNAEAAKGNLKTLDEDLTFLRDQIVTTEVNIARIHNWDVKQRKMQRASAATASA